MPSERVGLGVIPNKVMLFNFFFLLLTKVVKWVVGILELDEASKENQDISKHCLDEALDEVLTHKMRPMRSLASPDNLAKYSSGKLKSPRRMLLLVSSCESSRNGDKPLKAT